MFLQTADWAEAVSEFDSAQLAIKMPGSLLIALSGP